MLYSKSIEFNLTIEKHAIYSYEDTCFYYDSEFEDGILTMNDILYEGSYGIEIALNFNHWIIVDDTPYHYLMIYIDDISNYNIEYILSVIDGNNNLHAGLMFGNFAHDGCNYFVCSDRNYIDDIKESEPELYNFIKKECKKILVDSFLN